VVQAGVRIARLRRAAALAQRARALHPVGDRGNQVLGPDRLGQEVVTADAQCLVMLVLIALAGQEHDRRVQELVPFADQGGEFGAVALRHVEVHQHQIGPEALQRRHHVEGLGDHQRLHPGIAQDRLGEQCLRAVVFHHQDAELLVLRAAGQHLVELAEDLVHALRAHQQCVRPGATRSQAYRHAVLVRDHQQRHARTAAFARAAQGRGDVLERTDEGRIDDHRIGAERAEEFLELPGRVDQFQLMAQGFEPLVQLDRQRAAVGEVVEALRGALRSRSRQVRNCGGDRRCGDGARHRPAEWVRGSRVAAAQSARRAPAREFRQDDLRGEVGRGLRHRRFGGVVRGRRGEVGRRRILDPASPVVRRCDLHAVRFDPLSLPPSR
jgi:hypothetical protein